MDVFCLGLNASQPGSDVGRKASDEGENLLGRRRNVDQAFLLNGHGHHLLPFKGSEVLASAELLG